MVSDKDPEILSWLENQGGVTLVLMSLDIVQLKKFQKKERRLRKLFIDYIIENERLGEKYLMKILMKNMLLYMDVIRGNSCKKVCVIADYGVENLKNIEPIKQDMV